MMKKVKDFFKRLLYALPFGLKGADTEIMGAGNVQEGNGTTINQQISDNRVAKSLLKGEVTQAVEELRYRNYKVSAESKKFDYIGNGLAVKKDLRPKDRTKIRFTQDNKLLCSDVLEELNHVNNYGNESYTAEIGYDGIVRFKLENFIKEMDISIDNDKDGNMLYAETTLHFEAMPNAYDKKSMPFINELKKLKELYDSKAIYGIERNEIASSMISLTFVTYKASNDEPDMERFNFLMPHFLKIEESNNQFKITYKWDSAKFVNLADKYFSKTMFEKYKNKEKKDVDANLVEKERVRYCSVCGKEIPVYDGDILDYTTGKPMCLECYKKSLLADDN